MPHLRPSMKGVSDPTDGASPPFLPPPFPPLGGGASESPPPDPAPVPMPDEPVEDEGVDEEVSPIGSGVSGGDACFGGSLGPQAAAARERQRTSAGEARKADKTFMVRTVT